MFLLNTFILLTQIYFDRFSSMRYKCNELSFYRYSCISRTRICQSIFVVNKLYVFNKNTLMVIILDYVNFILINVYMYLKMGDVENSLSFQKRALELSVESQDLPAQLKSHGLIAVLCSSLNMFDDVRTIKV